MEATSDRTVAKTIAIAAPISKVWEALTTPALMSLWMSDVPIGIVSEWKTGSAISIHNIMNGEAYQSKGTILRLEPPNLFSYSYWNPISRVADVPENYSMLEFQLSRTEDATQLVFTQSNFVGEATVEHAAFFWNVALEVMKRRLETP